MLRFFASCPLLEYVKFADKLVVRGHAIDPSTKSESCKKLNRAIALLFWVRRTIIREMVLIIDNYDSFTYNLVQYLGEMKVDLEVRRNDQISLDQIRDLNPERILVSPGPCSPRESGLSNDIIRTFGPKVPLFGVCLGHQCIGYTFGGEVIVNYRIMHGKTSPIKHNGRDLFQGTWPNPLRRPPAIIRWSSKRETLPDCLEMTAGDRGGGEIMGSPPQENIQFAGCNSTLLRASPVTENGRHRFCGTSFRCKLKIGLVNPANDC